jgi:hypothetical protein
LSFPILAGATGRGTESRVNAHTPYLPSATYTLLALRGAHFVNNESFFDLRKKSVLIAVLLDALVGQIASLMTRKPRLAIFCFGNLLKKLTFYMLGC